MGKVAIVTDSNSGITQKQGKELGIYGSAHAVFYRREAVFEDIR